jgi:RNA polymerase sigma-70 factor, ECF subfamily
MADVNLFVSRQDMESDWQLIESINKGNTDAFGTLYYRYRDWVFGLAWRITGNHQDAQDVLQETFTYLLEKFPGFNLTASMTTFLYPVVKNLSLNAIRNKDKFISQQDLETEPPAGQMPDSTDSRTELAEVLANFSEENREVLLMRFVDDMTITEIAEALNQSESAVKSRLYRALELLRSDNRTKKYFLE